MPQPVDEPLDPADLPIAQLGRAGAPDGPERPSPSHLRGVVIGAAVVVVVGLVVGIVLVNSFAPTPGRGAATAPDAAQTYLDAVNRGNGDDAAAIACDAFSDEARAAARTGSDPGIAFVAGPVRMQSKTAGAVTVTEVIHLPGGHVQRQPATLDIERSAGRWLMCGRAG